MGGPLLLAALVVVVGQALGALVVMRGMRDRDDLGTTARLIPTAIAFLVPVIGPIIAGRLAGAGLRPALVSTAGLTLAMGLYVMGPQAPTPSGEPLGGTGLPGQKAAQPKAEPAAKTEAVAAKSTPAPTPKPQPAAAPAPQPQSAVKPLPAVKQAAVEKAAQPAKPQTAAKPAPPPVAPKTEGTEQPADVVPGMAAQNTLSVSLNTAATYETRLAAGPCAGGWLNFAAAFMSPQSTGTPVRHFYVGGYVRNFDLLTVDRFAPLPVDDSDLRPGKVIDMDMRRGTYHAMLRIDKVTRDDKGAVQAVDLLVTIK